MISSIHNGFVSAAAQIPIKIEVKPYTKALETRLWLNIQLGIDPGDHFIQEKEYGML